MNQNVKSSGKKIAVAFTAIALLSLLSGIILTVSLIASETGTLGIALSILFTIIITIASFVCGVVISKSISEKINNLSEKISSYSKGNFNISFRTECSDDIDNISNKIADITETLSIISSDILNISKIAEQGGINIKINEAHYPNEYKIIAKELNSTISILIDDTNTVAESFKNYIGGNIDEISLNFKGEKAIYNDITKTDNNNQFFGDITAAIEAACGGDFSEHIDEKKYSGQLKEFVTKINNLLDSINEPTKEILKVFLEISQSNNYRTTIQGNYKGVFGSIKRAVNDSLDIIGGCLKDLLNVFNEISKQNLNISLNSHYKGDFEHIKNYVDITINSFNELIFNLEKSAKQIASQSSQVTNLSNNLSGKTFRQTDAINKLNIGISKLSEQSEETEKSILESNKLAAQAKENASVGNNQMNDMLSAMNQINDASNSISNIIKVIDDIAFQTNILALNAAVEAARAGEHGKGFAVVADEVRTLASRSQQAAKETTELIENSIEKISDGSNIAKNTAESFADIIEKINTISSLIEKTSQISSEHSHEIESLKKGIDEIDSVAREISSVSESALISNVLEKNSDALMTMISKFKLKPEKDIKKDHSSKQKSSPKTNVRPINNNITQKTSEKPVLKKTNNSPSQSISNFNDSHLSAGVSKAAATITPSSQNTATYDIDVIDFDKVKDFGKY